MGFSFRNLTAATLAIGSLAVLAGTANAQTPLVPGATIAPVPDVPGGFGGTQLFTSTTTFNAVGAGNNVISGTLISSVFRVGAVGSALDFVFQLNSSSASTTNINSVNIVSFAGFNTAVAQSSTDTDGAGPLFPPSAAQNQVGNAFRSGDGEGVQFTFSDSIDPNTNSRILIVRTNATNFSTAGSAGILGNGVGTTTASTVAAPAAAVNVAPEPGTVALVAMGLMGTAGMVIRRRKA